MRDVLHVVKTQESLKNTAFLLLTFNADKVLYCSTEDMSFEFKKAFDKATERRALTFNQQWAMTDIAIYSSESPVNMALYNVPPGKKFSIRQLQGTYGPFLIKSTHYDVYQENC